MEKEKSEIEKSDKKPNRFKVETGQRKLPPHEGFSSEEEMRRSEAIRFLPRLLLLLCLSLSPLLHAGQAFSSSLLLNKEAEEAVGARTLKQDQEHSHEVHCSRARSRTAWQITEEYLMPFVEQEKYQISTKCRLHADNDMFRDQELHKINVDVNHWQCGYCKKSFRAEKFLDQHFDSRHYNLLNESNGKCMADLCGALHCDHVMDSKVRKSKCNPAATSRNKHLCESLADNCFPASAGPSASRLHEFFLRQFCDAHTCNGKRKPFPRGGKKHTGMFYIAISILTLLLLPVFYVIVYLHQMDKKTGIQDLKRISQNKQKMKPS